MTMTLKISPEMDAKLAAEARRRRVSKSRVAREMIDAGLKKRRPRVSLYDRIRDIAGSLEGPGDLSTNPKYMEGFGE